ncbi:MAG TPA: hypothetical protein VFM71_02670, partial [Gemmatimonadaceae bacterium]|nr:hypothetical protein [Gemmatimonadaceae bacterium]
MAPASTRRWLAVTLLVVTCFAAPKFDLAAQDAPQVLPAAAPQRVDPRAIAQREQERFENHRRRNLPGFRGRRPRDCQEVVGRFCYWYDEDSPEPAPEPATIIEARHHLIDVLDSLGRENPADNWIAGQRVRYLNESGRNAEALAVARECEAYGWWCDALEGFALHALGRYVESEEAYGRVLAAMRPRERCDWVSLVPHLDDDTRQVYNRHTCGEPEREAFEARVWWLSRTRYAMP